MVAAELSSRTGRTGDWVCLECEESGASDEELSSGDTSERWGRGDF